MKAEYRKELAARFGERISFDKTEMLFYAHDTASLPGMVKQMFKTVPEAVVQPLNTEEVVYITRFAREKSIPVTPRGAASSGWGGAIPTKGGIVVDFSRMRRILAIDKDNATVQVEAGVIWKNLETELNKNGLALRIYPSSAPSATAAGWVAKGGGGIGSYEYGQIGHNVKSVTLVTPEGEVRTMEDDDLELVIEAEGITGMITEVTVKTRKAEEDVPVVASFPTMKHLLKALRDVEQNSLPLWHVSFSNATFATKQEEAGIAALKALPGLSEHKQPVEDILAEKRCRVMFVYDYFAESASPLFLQTR